MSETREILTDWGMGLLGVAGNWLTFGFVGYTAHAMIVKNFPTLTKEQVVTILFIAAVVWIRPCFAEGRGRAS